MSEEQDKAETNAGINLHLCQKRGIQSSALMKNGSLNLAWEDRESLRVGI